MPVCRPRFSSGFGRKRTVGSRGEKKHRLLLLIVVATPMSKAAAFFSLSLSLYLCLSAKASFGGQQAAHERRTVQARAMQFTRQHAMIHQLVAAASLHLTLVLALSYPHASSALRIIGVVFVDGESRSRSRLAEQAGENKTKKIFG